MGREPSPSVKFECPLRELSNAASNAFSGSERGVRRGQQIHVRGNTRPQSEEVDA